MAGQLQHAFDFLEREVISPIPRIVVAVGDDRFLTRQVLDRLLGTGHDLDYDTYEGESVSWSEIADDLATVSLFSSGPRRVLVRRADPLVSRYRKELETFAAGETTIGTLILDLQSLPSNTRLFGVVADHGWLVECRPPTKSARSKTPDYRRMKAWLVEWGVKQHQIRLSHEAADELTELVGWEFGILDQEMAKLALFVEPSEQVDARLVRRVVGGWKTKTTWEMLDSLAEGDAGSALQQLEYLLRSGESPQAIYGAMAWSLRRFAAATRIVQRQERRGVRVRLQDVVEQAGFRKWPVDSLQRAQSQLRQISRQRGSLLYDWLLETDLALKGSHAAPQRARWALEQLILRLSRHARAGEVKDVS